MSDHIAQCTVLAAIVCLSLTSSSRAEAPPIEAVDGQPLAANVRRVLQSLEFLGKPLPQKVLNELHEAAKNRDGKHLQKTLDQHVLFVVSLNPEVRVKVNRGPAKAELSQNGFTPVLVKVINHSTVTRQLRISSPQAGPLYAGASIYILGRQAQTELNENENKAGDKDRFLEVDMYQSPPMTKQLSGLEVEYAIALIYSKEAGKREATIGFDVGDNTQDIGFRGELPVLFNVTKAIPVRLNIKDHDGQTTVARLLIRDKRGQIHPPQAKRLAPDFFFQPHIYRGDGMLVWLPPGEYSLTSSRGPEYRVQHSTFTVKPNTKSTDVDVQLARWVNPMQHGFYCGDHHIHGAGCSHYESPTQGVTPQDMFLQVKGEGLNVGCVLTWGPCFDFQRQYFSPTADRISEPLTIMKYDLEISGFGSAALGHVCLLNLKNQTYPGSDGTKTQGWPTWTVPVMRWCKEQGGVTGYPHSAMHVNPAFEVNRLLENLDSNKDKAIGEAEAKNGLLPYDFKKIDTDGNGTLGERELVIAIDRAADELPNLAVPAMNGAGAMEICVSTAEGVCDFISAMDTARIPEWNTWYHLLNCGFPLKLSGETDFPCMSSRRVGQGRVYVQLGKQERVDFSEWCEGIRLGRSYVSDGFAHALDFAVNEKRAGFGDVKLVSTGTVRVTTTVSFAPEVPKAVAYGLLDPAAGRRMVGDTINLHAPRATEMVKGGKRTVEIVVNGHAVAQRNVPADGKPHQLKFDVPITQSSWVAVRQFPQLHTNPVNVLVGGKPIRASANSARWCIESIRLLWKNRHKKISDSERAAARAAYDRAITVYERIAMQAKAANR